MNPEPLSAIEALEACGYEAWAVGGCVRDSLLGRETNDFDIACSASWSEAEDALAKAGFTIHRTGVKHGTITAIQNRTALEVTSYRTESTYSDGRHPDTIEIANTIQEDLARRDFTINAMAYHPTRGLLDPYDGLADLTSKTIRAVGDPTKRFSEDGLRILRALRFASQLGFSIEPLTLEAMIYNKMMLNKVSSERVTNEMDKLLLGNDPYTALMEGAPILGALFPELIACIGFDQHTPYHKYDVWEHTAWVVQYMPATRLGRWSAFFHDAGKPGAFFMEDGRGHFYGHAKLSIILAQEIMNRLKMSPTFIARALSLVRVHDNVIGTTEKSVKRALAKLDGDQEMFETLLALKRADCLAQSDFNRERLVDLDAIERIYADILANNEAFTLRQLAINGHDLMETGIAQGPHIGETLDALLDAVIEGSVANERDELLALALQSKDNTIISGNMS